MSKSKPIIEQIKDVVTLNTAKENFLKNDGTLVSWFNQGTNEFANMVLHGQPAPIYGGPTTSPEFTIHGPAEPSQSILDQTMHQLHQMPEIEAPEKEIGK